jgi:hypothetical protein
MSFWKPDQTFYPSPRMAMQGPQEKLGYVAVFNPEPKNGRHDALCVLDLDPTSPPTARSLGAPKCPELVTNCIISDGMHAAPRCAPTPHIHTSSAAT